MSDTEECRLILRRLRERVDEIAADVRRFEAENDRALVRRENALRLALPGTDRARMGDIDLRALAERMRGVRPNARIDPLSDIGERTARDRYGLPRLISLQGRISATIRACAARVGLEFGVRPLGPESENVASEPKSPDAIGLVESDVGELSGLIAQASGIVVPSFLNDVVPDWGEFERLAKEHEARCGAYRMMREEISDGWDAFPVRRINRTESALTSLQSSVTLHRMLAIGFGAVAEVLDVVVWTYVGMITRWVDSFWKACTRSRNVDEPALAFLWTLVDALLWTLRRLVEVLERIARVAREFVTAIARVVEHLALG